MLVSPTGVNTDFVHVSMLLVIDDLQEKTAQWITKIFHVSYKYVTCIYCLAAVINQLSLTSMANTNCLAMYVHSFIYSILVHSLCIDNIEKWLLDLWFISVCWPWEKKIAILKRSWCINVNNLSLQGTLSMFLSFVLFIIVVPLTSLLQWDWIFLFIQWHSVILFTPWLYRNFVT